jgi:hypothetical protein
MKRSLLTLCLIPALFFVLIFSCKKNNSPAPVNNVNLKKGLLVYLPFKGNLADSSGNGNTTTAAGMTLTNDEHGNANSAIQGTGNGERLLVTNNGSIKFDTAFTISMNCMIRSVKTQCFASLVNNSTGLGPTFEVCANIPNSPVLDFAVIHNDAACNAPGSASVTTDTSQYAVAPESWYNVIAVFHKGTLQLYVNGALVSTKTGATTTCRICPDAKLIIGGWWDNDPISVNGKLDEVRLYDRVLNSDEIASLSENFK